MKRVIIFSGTSEGRLLAEKLAESGISSVVSVASSYGSMVMKENALIHVHVGRMDEEQIRDFITGAGCVVDATHPFATQVSKNIKNAAKKAAVKYIRLLRDKSASLAGEDVRMCKSTGECIKALEKTEGRVLLTTGAKEVGLFTNRLKGRIIARVLPFKESLDLCAKAGLSESDIIAARGPFSVEENIRDIKKNKIDILVTKESGKAGGFEEKLKAAERCGAEVFVIERPREKGQCFDEVFKWLKENL